MPVHMDDLLRWIANREDVRERAEEIEEKEHPLVGDPYKSLMLVGPPRSGKTVIVHAMAREIILPPVRSQGAKFKADMRSFPDIEFDLGSLDERRRPENIDELTEELASYADRTGLQTRKTEDMNAEVIGSIHRGQLDFSVTHRGAHGRSVNLSLDVADLSGEWFNQKRRYMPQILDLDENKKIPTELEPDFEQFLGEIANAIQAGMLLITVPFRYPRNTRLGMRVMLNMYLSALLPMAKHMLREGTVKKLPKVVFCFTKYEYMFDSEDSEGNLAAFAGTRRAAFRKLSAFVTKDQVQEAIWERINDFYGQLEIVSGQYNLEPPDVWLSCMSAFGFQEDGTPNLVTLDRNEDSPPYRDAMDSEEDGTPNFVTLGSAETDADVLASSSVGKNECADKFEFDILQHWRPLGVMQPFYIAATPFLWPQPELAHRALADERPILNFREFTKSVPFS